MRVVIIITSVGGKRTKLISTPLPLYPFTQTLLITGDTGRLVDIMGCGGLCIKQDTEEKAIDAGADTYRAQCQAFLFLYKRFPAIGLYGIMTI